MDIFCLVLITPFVQAGFYEKIDSKSVHFSEVISETSAPSTIACIHHCRYIDKEAGTIYMNNVCKCVKKSEASDPNKMTVSGVFLQERKIKGDTNVALVKPTSQSSTFKDCNTCNAALANDGLENTSSVTANTGNAGYWWQVDLQRQTTIKRIELVLHKWAFHNGKYSNVVIAMRDNDNTTWAVCKDIGIPEEPYIKTPCDTPLMVGRYVRVSAGQVLYLNEVKIIAIE